MERATEKQLTTKELDTATGGIRTAPPIPPRTDPSPYPRPTYLDR